MKISSANYKISFKGEKDEFQPLSPNLRAVFSDTSIPKSKQRLLWELSEVPYFYKADNGLSKDEFIKLADFIQTQDTNILEMALKGDVRIINKDKEINTEGRSFFFFFPLAKRNRKAPVGTKKNLIDYIKEHQIFKIINDVTNLHKESNIYPEIMPYEIQKDENGNTTYTPINTAEAQANLFLSSLFTGKIFNKNNAIIIFKKPIKGKNDFDYNYKPINPKNVEPQYPVEPECIKFLLSIPGLDSNIKKSVSALSKIPYFNNLVCTTPPNILAKIALLNIDSDMLLEDLFKGKVTIGVLNPKTQKEVKRPVIDVGKLLQEKKEGKISPSNLMNILAENTLAIETCIMHSLLKKETDNEKIKYILISKKEDKLIHKVVTSTNKTKLFIADNNSLVTKKFSDFIEKVPYKSIVLNFDEK